MVSLKKMAKLSILSQAKRGLISVNRESIIEGVGSVDGEKGVKSTEEGLEWALGSPMKIATIASFYSLSPSEWNPGQGIARIELFRLASEQRLKELGIFNLEMALFEGGDMVVFKYLEAESVGKGLGGF